MSGHGRFYSHMDIISMKSLIMPKKGKECRHNLGYWTRKEYLGFGVGSASLFQNQRFTNLRDLRVYGEFNGNPESIRRDRETLTVGDQMEET